MSPPEEPTTLPAVLASAPSKPTPTSMQAVTIESRVAAIEEQIRRLTADHPVMFSELRAEIASLRADCRAMVASSIADESKKREELASRIDKRLDEFAATLDRLEKASSERTVAVTEILAILQPFKSVLGHPKVQTALIGLVVAAIFALTALLTSKGSP